MCDLRDFIQHDALRYVKVKKLVSMEPVRMLRVDVDKLILESGDPRIDTGEECGVLTLLEPWTVTFFPDSRGLFRFETGYVFDDGEKEMRLGRKGRLTQRLPVPKDDEVQLQDSEEMDIAQRSDDGDDPVYFFRWSDVERLAQKFPRVVLTSVDNRPPVYSDVDMWGHTWEEAYGHLPKYDENGEELDY